MSETRTNAEERYLDNVNSLGPRVAFQIEENRPFRCKLGWHSWEGHFADFEEVCKRPWLMLYRFRTCSRCGLKQVRPA